MLKRTIESIDRSAADKTPRESVADILNFMNTDKCYDGNVLVLYGLRRTGKTTMVEQAFSSYTGNEKCAFYEVQNGDDLGDIQDVLVHEKANDVSIICFDEVTKASDFITNVSVLADVFAKEGMKIILAGTDSLAFHLADSTELYDRTVQVKTTHITFAEHAKVLGVSDIDDYIEYGGLMRPGADRNSGVYDYESACKYLDSSVAENIVNSIQKSAEDNCLEVLPVDEMKTIIEKLVEIYGGRFDKKLAQRALTTVSVNDAPKRVSTSEIDADIINKLVSKKEKQIIAKEFLPMINASDAVKTQVTDTMISKLRKYLLNMDVLSATPLYSYEYNDAIGWDYSTDFEYYIVQPAIKYYHLQEGKKFFLNSNEYKELTQYQRNLLAQKLDEKIKGDMLEQIVLFDVRSDLNDTYFDVLKPEFRINGQKKGEYDMLIYDKQQNGYWCFEIKHSKHQFDKQVIHLKNEKFKEVIDKQYGERIDAYVLYRGETVMSDFGIQYVNVTDFLSAIHEFHNLHLALHELHVGSTPTPMTF